MTLTAHSWLGTHENWSGARAFLDCTLVVVLHTFWSLFVAGATEVDLFGFFFGLGDASCESFALASGMCLGKCFCCKLHCQGCVV